MIKRLLNLFGLATFEKIKVDDEASVWILPGKPGTRNYAVVKNTTNRIVFNRLLEDSITAEGFYEGFKNKSFERGSYK